MIRKGKGNRVRAAKVENSLVIVVVWMLSLMGTVQSIIYDQRLSTEGSLDLFSAVESEYFRIAG